MQKKAIYPGTYDPITLGHIDVIERASKIFDEVIVVIAKNSSKVTLFDEDERLDMVINSTNHIKNVSTQLHHKLTVESAFATNSIAIIRGLRAVSDFDYEFQLSLMNRKLAPDVHTIFLMPNEKYTYLNSTIVRELARYGKDVSEFVPNYVAQKLHNKFNNKN